LIHYSRSSYPLTFSLGYVWFTLVRFEELTDGQWKLLVPSIPLPAYTGRPRADDRSCINGMLYVLMSGCRWMDMPTKYGSYKTVWERHKKWSDKGVCMEKYYEFPGVTWIYFWIDIDRRPFCG